MFSFFFVFCFFDDNWSRKISLIQPENIVGQKKNKIISHFFKKIFLPSYKKKFFFPLQLILFHHLSTNTVTFTFIAEQRGKKKVIVITTGFFLQSKFQLFPVQFHWTVPYANLLQWPTILPLSAPLKKHNFKSNKQLILNHLTINNQMNMKAVNGQINNDDYLRINITYRINVHQHFYR